MSALSRRARDALGRLASTSSDASTRAFFHARFTPRARRETSSARARDDGTRVRRYARGKRPPRPPHAQPARDARDAREHAPTRVSRVDALRHAGASWLEVFKTREARDEIARAFMAGARAGTKTPRAPTRAAKRAWATIRRWRRAAGEAVPVTALRHAGGSWLDVLTHPEFKTQLWKARPFQPVWLRQGAMDAAAAREARKRGKRDVVNPMLSLRHAGVSRLGALMHEKVREYYWARAAAAYARTVVERPFVTAMFSSVTKCVVSDAFVQIVMEEKSVFALDWNRVASFFILGVTYVGAFQYRLYNHWLKPLNDAWRPKYGLALSTGGVVMIDQAFVQPFLYLPTFLGIRVLSEGGCRIVDLPSEVFAKWEKTAFDTVSALWCVWVPAQLINFAVIPKHLTIPWMNAIGLMWNGVLSYMHGRYEREDKQMTASVARVENAETESQDDEQDDE
mgnify:FL=1